MATKAWVAKQARREALVTKYAEVRRQLKKQKNYAALAKLPRDSSPTRSHFRCLLTGRSKGVLVASFHTPCRSGLPHGVFGAVQFLAAAAGFAAGFACAARFGA